MTKSIEAIHDEAAQPLQVIMNWAEAARSRLAALRVSDTELGAALDVIESATSDVATILRRERSLELLDRPAVERLNHAAASEEEAEFEERVRQEATGCVAVPPLGRRCEAHAGMPLYPSGLCQIGRTRSTVARPCDHASGHLEVDGPIGWCRVCGARGVAAGRSGDMVEKVAILRAADEERARLYDEILRAERDRLQSLRQRAEAAETTAREAVRPYPMASAVATCARNLLLVFGRSESPETKAVLGILRMALNATSHVAPAAVGARDEGMFAGRELAEIVPPEDRARNLSPGRDVLVLEGPDRGRIGRILSWRNADRGFQVTFSVKPWEEPVRAATGAEAEVRVPDIAAPDPSRIAVLEGFVRTELDPDRSRLYCTCGATFTWTGTDPGLLPWMAAHEPHQPMTPEGRNRLEAARHAEGKAALAAIRTARTRREGQDEDGKVEGSEVPGDGGQRARAGDEAGVPAQAAERAGPVVAGGQHDDGGVGGVARADQPDQEAEGRELPEGDRDRRLHAGVSEVTRVFVLEQLGYARGWLDPTTARLPDEPLIDAQRARKLVEDAITILRQQESAPWQPRVDELVAHQLEMARHDYGIGMVIGLPWPGWSRVRWGASAVETYERIGNIRPLHVDEEVSLLREAAEALDCAHMTPSHPSRARPVVGDDVVRACRVNR